MKEFSRDISENKRKLESVFARATDVTIQQLESQLEPPSEYTHLTALLVYCPGLCDVQRLDEVVLPQLRTVLRNLDQTLGSDNFITEIALPSTQQILTYSEVADAVFAGKLVVFTRESAHTIDIAKKPNRSPEESKFEISLFGGRDGFIEDIVTNVALVRKRLNKLTLCVETYYFGKLNRTAVSLLYLEDKVDRTALDEVKNQLQSTEVDLVQSNVELTEMMSPAKYAFMPRYRIVGRPDFAVDSLRQGRFCLLVDGTPSALIAPVNLAFLVTSSDDPYVSFPFAVAERALRYIALCIALLGPGLYVGITSLHPDQVPLSLLATLVNSRTGLPLPTPLEAFFMLLLFEIFKESGTHLPQPAGNTLSVVGGLIIGDAAIRAGMTSPSLVVVISASAVSLYAVTNHALASIVSILRVAILILSAIFGLFGFIISCIFITTYFAHVRSFGVPFLAPMSPFEWKTFKQTYIAPWTRKRGNRV